MATHLGYLTSTAQLISRRCKPLKNATVLGRVLNAHHLPVPPTSVSIVRSGSDCIERFEKDNSFEILEDDHQFSIVNFYHLVDIKNPLEVVQEHKNWMRGRDIRGRIYLSAQGINAQYTGMTKDALAYPLWLEQKPEFQDLSWTSEPACDHLFPKLRLQFKPNLVSLKGGMSTLDVTRTSARATPLSPAQWKGMLHSSSQSVKSEKQPVLLDVRNGYEWDAGHFQGAERPVEDAFAQTPVGDDITDVPEPLSGQDPDTPVLMYCTGGIRCDVYSTFLRKKGYNNLFSLEGGVHNYFDKEGGDLWNGSLFVFDERLAVPPSKDSMKEKSLPGAIPCEICRSCPAVLPHNNCANVDCNKLFVSCESCKSHMKGCCCEECISAPRLLRPISSECFKKWGEYTQGSKQSRRKHMIIHTGSMDTIKSHGKEKKTKRHIQSKARRDAAKEFKRLRKLQMKEAMQRFSESKPSLTSMQQHMAYLDIQATANTEST